MLFDTHAHYDDERFDEDRDALLASMPENNVGLILNPGCDAGTSRKAVGYANRYPFVYAAVGLHPENIEDGWTQTLDEIRTLAQSEPRVRAIGEIGLDYYWEKEERARARQLQLARQLHLTGENNLLPCARTLFLLPVIIKTDLSDGTDTRLALRERADFIQRLRPAILDILRMKADRSINKRITVRVADRLA